MPVEGKGKIKRPREGAQCFHFPSRHFFVFRVLVLSLPTSNSPMKRSQCLVLVAFSLCFQWPPAPFHAIFLCQDDLMDLKALLLNSLPQKDENYLISVSHGCWSMSKFTLRSTWYLNRHHHFKLFCQIVDFNSHLINICCPSPRNIRNQWTSRIWGE